MSKMLDYSEWSLKNVCCPRVLVGVLSIESDQKPNSNGLQQKKDSLVVVVVVVGKLGYLKTPRVDVASSVTWSNGLNASIRTWFSFFLLRLFPSPILYFAFLGIDFMFKQVFQTKEQNGH